MADWRKLATDAILADGKIDEVEVKVLKKHLWEDGKIDDEEVKFLIELRAAAQKKAKAKKEELTPSFTKLFNKAISENVLKDGKIDAEEAKWLREMLFADGKIDQGEWDLVQELNKKAKEKHADFEALFKEVETKAAKLNKSEKAGAGAGAAKEKAAAGPKE